MPKRPGTTARSVRIDDDLWTAALKRAAERGETVSLVIRKELVRYTR